MSYTYALLIFLRYIQQAYFSPEGFEAPTSILYLGPAEKVTSALDTTGRSEDVCLYLELKDSKYLLAGKGGDEVLVASFQALKFRICKCKENEPLWLKSVQ